MWWRTTARNKRANIRERFGEKPAIRHQFLSVPGDDATQRPHASKVLGSQRESITPTTAFAHRATACASGGAAPFAITFVASGSALHARAFSTTLNRLSSISGF